MIKLAQLLETRLRTKQGSVIQRFKNNVGKQVGSRVYVHKLYADEIIPKAIWTKANQMLTRAHPDFAFNTVMFDPAAKTVRFDEAPDFDTASEPHVGDFVEINVADPNVKTGHSDSIWHHKWLWVKDDYTGFDVDKSKEWSKLWLSKLNEPAKGQEMYWQSQLRNVGLLIEGKTSGQDWAYGGVRYPDVVIAYISPPESPRIGHERNMGRHRWVYKEEYKKVFWHDFPIDNESKVAVENWLAERGYEVKQHHPMEDMYKVFTKESVVEASVESLSGGKRLDQINQLIQQLEAEWERLDSQGTGHTRQLQIQQELAKLRKEKEQWNTVYRTIEKEPNRGIVTKRRPIILFPL